jgi:methionyl-tRNA formyltransferase
LWPPLAQGHIDFVPQDENKATYWPQRKPEDGELTPDMTVADVDRMVRAVTRPYPGAWFWLGDRKARIWAGHITSDDVTLVKTLKLPFKDGSFIATDFEWE